MASTRISPYYPPHVDVTKAPIAYGDCALPRMNRELKDDRILIRRRALMSLCDYLKDPEHIASAIQQGSIELLTSLLSDSDSTVRHKSTECFYVISGHAMGREALISRDVVPALSCLLDDDQDIVRKFVHLTFARTAQSPAAAVTLTEEHIVSMLVMRLTTEIDEILELILDTLHYCFKVDVQTALNCGAMKALTELLVHQLATIRSSSCRCIMGLAVTLQGKEQAIEDQCVAELVSLLNDSNMNVKANAAGALMRITVTTRGKYSALEADVLLPLIDLLADMTLNSEVRTNALKTLTCIAETPEGRSSLLQLEPQIRELLSDSTPTISAAAEKALKVILWKP